MRNKPTTPEQELGQLTVQLAAMMEDDQECFNKAIGKIAEVIKTQQYHLANKKLHATNSRSTATNSTGANTNSTALPALQQGELMQQLQQYCKSLMDEIIRNSAWYSLQCITVSEAADLLNAKEDCIRGWIEEGLIRASIINKRYYLRTRDIDKLLTDNATAVPMAFASFRTNRQTHLRKRFQAPNEFQPHHDGV
jgi:excisionase family DNA binding protein